MSTARSLELQAMSNDEFMKIPEIKACIESKQINVTRNRCYKCNEVIHEGHLTKLNDGTIYCQHCNAENRVMGLKKARLS